MTKAEGISSVVENPRFFLATYLALFVRQFHISKPAPNFFELVRALTSLYELSQAKKAEKVTSSKGTYVLSKVILGDFLKKFLLSKNVKYMYNCLQNSSLPA